MRAKIFMFCLTLILFCSFPVQAGSATNTRERHQQFQDPEKSGEQVMYAWRSGHWEYESLRGNYRFVITQAPESEANKLYIQWWQDDAENGGAGLLYSLSVKELNESPSFRFSEVECGNENCTDLSLVASHAFEGYEQEVAIRLGALGRYDIRW